MEMIYVDGGKFMMGATEEQEFKVQADGYPVQEESAMSYCISEFEVAQSQWEKLARPLYNCRARFVYRWKKGQLSYVLCQLE